MDSSFFVGNRDRLLQSIGGGALVVVTGYQEMQRGNDAAFLFEQEANFWYLTGIEAPDWRLIIDGKRRRSYAIMPHTSDMKQIFDGSLSAEEAKLVSGVDEVLTRDAADSLLLQLKREHPLVYTINEGPLLRQYVNFAINPAQKELSEYLKYRFQDVRSCLAELADMRAIKQPEEIKAIQKAIDITIKGFQEMRNELETYRYEYEAEAKLSYEFRRLGADGHAYSPILGSAHNACTLHYVANNAKLSSRSFLLIDAGAKYRGYAADLTRTYAIKQPTKRMIAIHDAVKHIQSEVISLCKPGVAIIDLQKKTEELVASVLKEIGLFKNENSVQKYFPHAISHGLGIDVHDSFGRHDSLVPGMVLTVEPGLYISEESIGVRIEDDILITDSGYRNLSKALSTDS